MKIFILAAIVVLSSCGKNGDLTQETLPGSTLEGKKSEPAVPFSITNVEVKSLVHEFSDHTEESYKLSPISSDGNPLLKRYMERLLAEELIDGRDEPVVLSFPYDVSLGTLWWLDGSHEEIVRQETIKGDGKKIVESMVEGRLSLNLSGELRERYRFLHSPEVTLYSWSRENGTVMKMANTILTRNTSDPLRIPTNGLDSLNEKSISWKFATFSDFETHNESRRRAFIKLSDFSLEDHNGANVKISDLWNQKMKDHAVVLVFLDGRARWLFSDGGETLEELLKRNFSYIQKGPSGELVKIEGHWDETGDMKDWSHVRKEDFGKGVLKILNGLGLSTVLEKGGKYAIVHTRVEHVFHARLNWKTLKTGVVDNKTNTIDFDQEGCVFCYLQFSARSISDRHSGVIRKKVRVTWRESLFSDTGDYRHFSFHKGELIVDTGADIWARFRERKGYLLQDISFSSLEKDFHLEINENDRISKLAKGKGSKLAFYFPRTVSLKMKAVGKVVRETLKTGFLGLEDDSYRRLDRFHIHADTNSRKEKFSQVMRYPFELRGLVPVSR